MALTAKSVADLQQYFEGVVKRAEHHAIDVSEVIYPLLGLIILHLDQNSDIEVREYNGIPTNMLWVHIRSTRYAFRYDHNNDYIEIRKDAATGQVLHTINNAKSVKDLIKIFKSL